MAIIDDDPKPRPEIPLDAPPWVMNPQPKLTHPTMSQDELIAQMRREIDFDLLGDLLSLTPAERIERHDAIALEIRDLCGIIVRQGKVTR